MGIARRVAVIGCGYVGTVVASCLATVGNRVVGVEIDEEKLALLQSGSAHFYEPGLDEVLRDALARDLLSFTSAAGPAVDGAEMVFLCVDAPDRGAGDADLRQLESALASIASHLRPGQVVVTKSTLPVGGGDWVAHQLQTRTGMAVPVVVNPEFLREGSAVYDFMYPHRVVIGGDDQSALDRVAALYEFLHGSGDDERADVLVTSRASAEIIKYAANTFLASRVSLINEIAEICDAVGADIEDVAEGVGADRRIGPAFLRAGLGWGGSCFGKDLSIFAGVAREAGVQPTLIEAAKLANERHRRWVFALVAEQLGEVGGKRVGLLGLAFKPGTDDLRDSPAVELARRLVVAGASVHVHDPAVKDVPGLTGLTFVTDAVAAASNADALVLATEWPEYGELDFAEIRAVMAGNHVVDTRNMWDGDVVRAAGLDYRGIGRAQASNKGLPPDTDDVRFAAQGG